VLIGPPGQQPATEQSLAAVQGRGQRTLERANIPAPRESA